MTSNLGCSKKGIGFTDNKNNEDIEDFFGIEFVNRIENIIKFNNIDKETCIKLIRKKLKLIRDNYKNKNIICSFSNNLIEEILKLSEYDKFGARKIDSIIKQKVETVLIDKMLEGETKIKVDKSACVL